MAEVRYGDISSEKKRAALAIASKQSGRLSFLLEKDIWVVATLGVLFKAPFGPHIVFKGGTSLSKAWGAIRRFSEDIDVTYDIRDFAPDMVAGGDDEAMPPTRSQERRWTQAIRPRLAEWVRDVACPLVAAEMERAGFAGRVRAESERLYYAYDPLFPPEDYVKPEVKVDFGARATGEPCVVRRVVCDAATHLPDVGFPEARPTVMLAERTFWEKATSMHVYCLQGRVRGERWSRHWHDLARLDEAGVAREAVADRELAHAVARHKAMFYRENDSDRRRIDYHAAVSGSLGIVPTGVARESLAADYERMVGMGMLLDEADPFDEIMRKCSRIEEMANAAAAADG